MKGKNIKGKKEKKKNRRALLSPADYRYCIDEVAEHLSDEAFVRDTCAVECALTEVLHQRGICTTSVVHEIERACKEITAEEVSKEETVTKHDIRALVNCIRRRVSDHAKPFVHMSATSYDIVDTANALRYKRVMQEVVIPELCALITTLIRITYREAGTIQIGRTHGQHAVPITFGFTVAGYVERLGNCMTQLKQCTEELKGKFSGAVGAYNASSLFFDDPEQFERQVCRMLGLEPARYSSQIVPHEAMMRLMQELGNTSGVIANIARDMRHLQRTEIGEVGEEFEEGQVGSSTMPHKRNPIGFENIESLWKVIVGRLVTVSLDQLSEHQRDLTSSASQRTYAEIVNYLVYMARRMDRTLKKLCVVRECIVRNLHAEGDEIGAEPLYLLLAHMGHPDAHEEVKKLSLEARREQKSLGELLYSNKALLGYVKKLSTRKQNIVKDPAHLYTGIAEKKAKSIARHWAVSLGIADIAPQKKEE